SEQVQHRVQVRTIAVTVGPECVLEHVVLTGLAVTAAAVVARHKNFHFLTRNLREASERFPVFLKHNLTTPPSRFGMTWLTWAVRCLPLTYHVRAAWRLW